MGVSYHDDGKAKSSEHADGADRVTFDYQPGKTVVTESIELGVTAQRTYHYTLAKGQLQASDITGDLCAKCARSEIKSRIFDA